MGELHVWQLLRMTGMTRMTVLRRVVAVAIAAAALVACGSKDDPSARDLAPSVKPGDDATSIERVSPIAEDGSLGDGYRVVATHEGAFCLSGSLAVGAAHRCFTDSGVFDPCWAEEGGRSVICAADP
jgi:hypothetical protein